MASNEKRANRNTLIRLLVVTVMIVSLIAGMFPEMALAAAANSDSITSSIPAAMAAGQSYTVKITVMNTGSATWTAAAGYKLACTAGAGTFANKTSYALPASVKPNTSVAITVVLTAPLKNGTFASAWQMSKGVALFGAALTKKVSVSISANNSLVAGSSAPSTATTSLDYTVSVSFKNTGSNRWTKKGSYTLTMIFSYSHPVLGKYSESVAYTLPSTDSIAFGATKKFRATPHKGESQHLSNK